MHTQSVWDFLQDEVLGMAWLDRLIGSMLRAFGVDTATQLGGGLAFFVYDTIKIIILLVVLIFMISYIQTYFPRREQRRFSVDFTASALIQSPRCWER